MYFRFKRQVKYIASEVGLFSADILFINKKFIHEIEVKVSWSDFRNDFKKFKHEYFLKDDVSSLPSTNIWAKDARGKRIKDDYGRFVKIGKRPMQSYINCRPHYFSFAVPPDLEEKAKEYIKENCPQYGLYVISEKWTKGKFPHQDCVSSRLRPAKLHNDKINKYIFSNLVSRMSSELANAKRDLWEEQNKGKK